LAQTRLRGDEAYGERMEQDKVEDRTAETKLEEERGWGFEISTSVGMKEQARY